MKRQITFDLDDKNLFAELTTDYFLKSGFKQKNLIESQLVFTKGSIVQNLVTFNPLNWKSKVVINMKEDYVVADFSINTFGQLVTPKEEKLWETFIDNYKLTVTDKLDLTTENERNLRETKSNSLTYIAWAFVGAIVGGVPFSFLAYFTGIDKFALLGIAIGMTSFLTFKIEKDRRKNTR